MSAFFLAINRDHAPFDEDVARRMLDVLAPFGPDGSELHVGAHFALGYQRRWTVPEEQGERQPLYDAEHDLWLLWHGRIDNREELLATLKRPLEASVSDAEMLRELYLQRGEDCFAEIVGPFVFVLYQPAVSKLVAARDCMGGRSLFYHSSAKVILLSTWELALAAHPQVGYRFNAPKIARLIAGMMDDIPSSPIAGASPLEPGQQFSWSGGRIARRVYYRPDPAVRIELENDKAYAAEFRRLLQQAVQRRLRGSRTVGVMLSGGHDSVPIAISAAQLLARDGATLQAFSWVFEKFPDSDERFISRGVCEDFAIEPNWINCDDIWPQFDEAMYRNPIMPLSTPYHAFSQALFERAERKGVDILLSGLAGDMLYTGNENAAYEHLANGQLVPAWREFVARFRQRRSLREFVRHYMLGTWFAKRLDARRFSNLAVADYLTEKSQQGLQAMVSFLAPEMWQARRPGQYVNVLGALEGEDAGYARHFETNYAIERRFPFRDRDLVEFMLAIPSHQLGRANCTRPIVKNAYVDEFRLALAERNSKTNFAPVITAGILQDDRYRQWMLQEGHSWQDTVNKGYLEAQGDGNEMSSHLKWRCGYYEYWKTMCYTPMANRLGSADRNARAK